MDRTAIFVDAGYLFAQGSAAIAGRKIARSNLVLDAPKALEALKRHVSLIVTDLIELARLGSIADAVLLSGDEDVRVGVQIAQSYGVRVHLLGIEPTRGSQSHQLLQEVDTTCGWGQAEIAEFLTVREDALTQLEETSGSEAASAPQAPADRSDILSRIELAVATFVMGLEDADLQGVAAYWKTARGIPADLDRRLLPICRAAIGRNLERDEIHRMRTSFRRAAQKRISNLD